MYRALRHRGKKQVNSSISGNNTNDTNGAGKEQNEQREGERAERAESTESGQTVESNVESAETGVAGVSTATVVSQILGLKPRTVQRYSQLLELPERMLELVGTKAKNEVGELRLPIRAGEVLSNLSKEKLSLIEEVLMDDSKNANVIITESTAKSIRKNCTLNREISKKEIEGIILKSQQNGAVKKPGKKSAKGRKKSGADEGGLLLDENRLRKFCGYKMTEKEVAELIYGLVEKWSKQK